MTDILEKFAAALRLAFGMFWEVGWSLVLGFFIAAVMQVFVSPSSIQKSLGRDGVREITLASLYGIASSSCSFASAAVARTLFKKGAAFVPSLAFLLASTNMVLELGLVLYVLLGWQFALAEWLGGIVLITVMALIVKATYPAKLVFEARHHPEERSTHMVQAAGPVPKFWQSFRRKDIWILVAHNFIGDFRMVGKDLVAGFVIGGLLATFVPSGWWQMLSFPNDPAFELPLNAGLGVLIAVVSFVCSIGNVPMAAVLWGSGLSFGGVLAFLYADLIVLPLLDVYRRYFGIKMAAYMTAVFAVTMVISAMLIELVFKAANLVPKQMSGEPMAMGGFSFNYTFWLNLALGGLGVYLFMLARRNPASHENHKHCCH